MPRVHHPLSSPLGHIAFVVCVLLGLLKCHSQIDWPQLTYTPATTNIFPHPTFIAHAGDNSGRLFIGQQDGVVRILRGSNVAAAPFLDLSTQTLQGWERGLLSLAFAPDFASNGHIYVNYTRKPDGATVVSRLVSEPNADVVLTNTEQIVLVVPQPFENHNGGQLAFGPDGYLYIGLGDGGGSGDTFNRAQNPTNLLGKILRIDVESGALTYSIPTNNPFVGNTNYAPEIWALGFRNPWRFSFDRLTGDLYIADVGETRAEEVNFQPATSPGGENYGWNVFEATLAFRLPPGFDPSSLTFPITAYPRSLGFSVTGGYVHRGKGELRMNGVYFFGDFGRGHIWGLVRSGTNWIRRQLATSAIAVSTFGESEDGSVYAADYSNGRLFRLGDSYEVLPPQLTPPGGSYNIEQNVLVTSVTPGAEIHFTMDGTDPTLADRVVPTNGIVFVGSNAVLKVRAFRKDLFPSEIVTGQFNLQVAWPEISPANGPITNGTLVTLSTLTPGSTIRFTTNGDPANGSSPIYTGPFFVDGNTAIHAQGWKDGFTPSEITYAFLDLVQVGRPSLSPDEQPVTNGTLISITGPTPNASYRFTLDGSEPTTNSALYTGPFAIEGETVVTARGFREDMMPSFATSAYYPLYKLPTPIFDSPNGPVTNGQRITISSESDALVRYTLDGTPPSLTSLQYTGSVALTGNQTLSARAFRFNSLDSDVHSVRYPLWIPEATVVTTIAGSGSPGFVDGDRRIAKFNFPQGVCVDSNGIVYVADFGNHAIRRIGTNGMVTTVAGNGTAGFREGASTNAQFNRPVGICFGPDGVLYVSDRENRRIRRITGAGDVTTIASNLNYLTHLTTAHGLLYFGSGGVVYSMTTNGTMLSIPTGPMVYDPSAVADPQTNVFVASSYLYVLKVQNFIPENYAGSLPPGFADGSRQEAKFPQYPDSTRGIVSDSSGNLYVADPTNIRRIGTNGIVSSLAGTLNSGSQDGHGRAARFLYASGLCVDSATSVYVADSGNHRIRKVWIDTDEDLIPDIVESASTTYIVGVDDRSADDDNDGLSNSEEYRAGSIPTNANSTFQVASAVLLTNGVIRIEWHSNENRTYSVESSDNLVDWTVLFANVFGTGGKMNVLDSRPQSPNLRLYRIAVRPF